ncbi:hypothetical protein V8E36_003806 [Tilletia maclaganii]
MNVSYPHSHIVSNYNSLSSHVSKQADADGTTTFVVQPVSQNHQFRTGRKVLKDGSHASRSRRQQRYDHTPPASSPTGPTSPGTTKRAPKTTNHYGSLVRASTIRFGIDPDTGEDIFVPFSNVVPMVHPIDFVLGGWDISGLPLDQAMVRTKVIDYGLQTKDAPQMASMKARHSRLHGPPTASTLSSSSKSPTRSATPISSPGVNDTAGNLLKAVEQSHLEVSPSPVWPTTSRTRLTSTTRLRKPSCPAALSVAKRHKAFIGDDDLQDGPEPRPLSIALYYHLGNDGGHNLSSEHQLKSREVSTVVMDDYTSELRLGGRNRLLLTNLCKDSLLASPLLLEPAIFGELMTRAQYVASSDKLLAV